MCECAGVAELVVFTKVKTVLLPWRILVSSLSVSDGFGSVGASLNEWAQMLRVGGQHARPWPDAPSPKTAAVQDSCSLRGCT